MQTSWVDLLHSTLSFLLLSLESGVDCPCPWFHANSLLLASLLSSRQLPSAGSRRQRPPAVQRKLLSAGSRRQRPPAVQRKLLSAGSRRQLPFASPYHFRIRRDFRSKNPLSGFAPKQTKESSALAAYPHSATYHPLLPLSFILNKLQHNSTTSKKNKNIYSK